MIQIYLFLIFSKKFFSMVNNVIPFNYHVSEEASHIFLAVFLLGGMLIHYVYIGIMAQEFSRTYKSIEAKAYLGMANLLLDTEMTLSLEKKRRYQKYFRRYCNPSVCYFHILSYKHVEKDFGGF